MELLRGKDALLIPPSGGLLARYIDHVDNQHNEFVGIVSNRVEKEIPVPARGNVLQGQAPRSYFGSIDLLDCIALELPWHEGWLRLSGHQAQADHIHRE